MVSVDTKKKELVGPFKNAGREWRPRGQAEPVRVHDFLDKALGKAIPYGVYDLTHDAGWVSVGVDHDTASFAVETLRRWWRRMGCVSYPVARRLLITVTVVAEGGIVVPCVMLFAKLQPASCGEPQGVPVRIHGKGKLPRAREVLALIELPSAR